MLKLFFLGWLGLGASLIIFILILHWPQRRSGMKQFRIVYEASGAQAAWLTTAISETAARSAFRRWFKETYGAVATARILYVTEEKQ